MPCDTLSNFLLIPVNFYPDSTKKKKNTDHVEE